MAQFTVQLDQKVEVWSRQTFFVDAENKEQAIEIAKNKLENEGADNFEYLSESEYILTPEENDNQETEQWIIDDETIESNSPN